MMRHPQSPSVISTDLVPVGHQLLAVPGLLDSGRPIDVPYEDVAGMVDYQTFTQIGELPFAARRDALRRAIRHTSFRDLPRTAEIDGRSWLVTRIY